MQGCEEKRNEHHPAYYMKNAPKRELKMKLNIQLVIIAVC